MKIGFKKILIYTLLGFLLVLWLLFGYFFVGSPKEAKDISWGVNFSQQHAQSLGLDWKQTYLALLDDLGVRKIKIAVQWDLIEPEEGKYNFEDLDWQVSESEVRGAGLILMIGIKTSRWPECHIPGWAVNLSLSIQEERALALIKEIVRRYEQSDAIFAWQVENEPFFPFGKCPWASINKKFFAQEIATVKNLDPKQRPVIVSDSGEGSFWIQAAKFGDIVGTTIYRKAWFDSLKTHINYPFPPVFYYRKAQIIKSFFGKDVICGELQAEPWGPLLLYGSSPEEQEKTMNLEQFKKNIDFAKKTGLKEFYLWGSEWWYWMKEKQGQPEIWNEAKALF